MMPVLQRLELTVNGSMAQEKANHLQDFLCGLLQVILVKVGHKVEKPLANNIV
jgi:hypothetical protein